MCPLSAAIKEIKKIQKSGLFVILVTVSEKALYPSGDDTLLPLSSQESPPTDTAILPHCLLKGRGRWRGCRTKWNSHFCPARWMGPIQEALSVIASDFTALQREFKFKDLELNRAKLRWAFNIYLEIACKFYNIVYFGGFIPLTSFNLGISELFIYQRACCDF